MSEQKLEIFGRTYIKVTVGFYERLSNGGSRDCTNEEDEFLGNIYALRKERDGKEQALREIIVLSDSRVVPGGDNAVMLGEVNRVAVTALSEKQPPDTTTEGED